MTIIFLLGYYIYLEVFSFPVFTIPTINTEIILIATQKDVLPNQILKKSLAKQINKFLKIPKKILIKKNG